MPFMLTVGTPDLGLCHRATHGHIQPDTLPGIVAAVLVHVLVTVYRTSASRWLARLLGERRPLKL